ncbi:hypothetical protein DMUE_5756 [Dictyocoela muelleri]|nr:hypothetical protein DMUE_5756 [Dictyocoela muelleri]
MHEHENHNHNGSFRTNTTIQGKDRANKWAQEKLYKINNNDSINIFTLYFKNGYLPKVDHVILNSKTNSLKILQYIEQLSNNAISEFKTTQFDYEVPNTGLKVKRDLKLFDSLSIDLFSATEMFKTTFL